MKNQNPSKFGTRIVWFVTSCASSSASSGRLGGAPARLVRRRHRAEEHDAGHELQQREAEAVVEARAHALPEAAHDRRRLDVQLLLARRRVVRRPELRARGTAQIKNSLNSLNSSLISDITGSAMQHRTRLALLAVGALVVALALVAVHTTPAVARPAELRSELADGPVSTVRESQENVTGSLGMEPANKLATDGGLLANPDLVADGETAAREPASAEQEAAADAQEYADAGEEREGVVPGKAGEGAWAEQVAVAAKLPPAAPSAPPLATPPPRSSPTSSRNPSPPPEGECLCGDRSLFREPNKPILNWGGVRTCGSELSWSCSNDAKEQAPAVAWVKKHCCSSQPSAKGVNCGAVANIFTTFIENTKDHRKINAQMEVLKAHQRLRPHGVQTWLFTKSDDWAAKAEVCVRVRLRVRVCVCVCVCVLMYVCIFTYMHACMHTYKQTYIHK
jgi:hypothetical protein